jgi:iron complex outermembrane receptor protein
MMQKGEKGQPVATEGSRQYRRWPAWDKEDIYFLSNIELGADSYLKLRAYHDTYKNILHMYTDDTYSVLRPGANGVSIYDDFTNGAIVEVGTSMLGKQNIRAIAQIKTDAHRAGADYNRPNDWKSYKDQLTSIGIEDSITVNSKLDLSLGVGLDTQKPLETGEYDSLNTQTFLQGQFGAFYKITDKLQTYFTFARKDRFPTLSNRFSSNLNTNIQNPDLRPELSTNYDIGAKALLFNWLQIEGAIFYSDITDLIERVDEVEPGKTQYQNVGMVKHQGIELSFFVKPVPWFETGIYYTYLHRENLSKPTERLRGVPKNRITGFTKVQPLKQLHFMASVQCQDNVWYTDTARLSGYTTANVTIGYRPFKGILIDGGFSNVLDRNYQQSLGYPLPGRSWFINGRYNF